MEGMIVVLTLIDYIGHKWPLPDGLKAVLPVKRSLENLALLWVIVSL